MYMWSKSSSVNAQIFLFWKCWTYQNLVQCIFEHAHLWNMFIPLEGECHWVLSGFVCLYMHMIMFIADIYILFCWKQWTLARQESEREREKLSPMTTKRPYKRFLSLECRYSCHRCQFNGEHGGYSYHHRHHCHCHHRPRCVKSRMTSQPASYWVHVMKITLPRQHERVSVVPQEIGSQCGMCLFTHHRQPPSSHGTTRTMMYMAWNKNNLLAEWIVIQFDRNGMAIDDCLISKHLMRLYWIWQLPKRAFDDDYGPTEMLCHARCQFHRMHVCVCLSVRPYVHRSSIRLNCTVLGANLLHNAHHCTASEVGKSESAFVCKSKPAWCYDVASQTGVPCQKSTRSNQCSLVSPCDDLFGLDQRLCSFCANTLQLIC